MYVAGDNYTACNWKIKEIGFEFCAYGTNFSPIFKRSSRVSDVIDTPVSSICQVCFAGVILLARFHKIRVTSS